MPATSRVEVLLTTVDSSYYLTVAMGNSVCGVVGVLFPWGERLLLTSFFVFCFNYLYRFFVCVF